MAESGRTETVDGVNKRRSHNEINTNLQRCEQQKYVQITLRIL